MTEYCEPMENLISKIRRINGFKNFDIEIVPETGSTNDDLKKYWFAINNKLNFIKKPKVLVAFHQTKGRGRFIDRIWKDEKGKALLFSFTWAWKLNADLCDSSCCGFYENYKEFIIPCTSKNKKITDIQDYINRRTLNLSLSSALSVYYSVIQLLGDKSNNLGLSIKWPNDVYILNKKLCGVLCETIIVSPNEMRAVIGIGINVKKFTEVVENSISLEEVGVTIDCFELLSKILSNWYIIESNFSAKKLKKLAKDACSYWFNKAVYITKPTGKKVMGLIKDLVFPGGWALFCEKYNEINCSYSMNDSLSIIVSGEILQI